MSHAVVVNVKFAPSIVFGALRADNAILAEITEAFRVAERAADDIALGSARLVMGIALLDRSESDRNWGLEALGQLREMCDQDRFFGTEATQVDMLVAREMVRQGQLESGLPLLRAATDQLFAVRHPVVVVAVGALVETLLGRANPADLEEAETRTAQLAADRFGGSYAWVNCGCSAYARC